MSFPYRTITTFNRVLPLVNRSLTKQQYRSILKPSVFYQPYPYSITLKQSRSFSLGLVNFQQQMQPQKEAAEIIKTATDSAVVAEGHGVNKKQQQQDVSKIRKYYNQVKELISFYKSGLKLLWANKKAVQELQKRIQEENYNLTRSEFQQIHINKIDMRKLIPFSIIFFILPESVSVVSIINKQNQKSF
ncbi:hypothetical protein BJ944DRAFT_54851 [Cunninghamella echinulata]|nr:hypothetical protein BJ944DRAFT_54851 [Cunninghamella echinulata]